MFLLYEYDIFWAFLIISSAIPVLAFLISGVLSPIKKGPEKLSSYESGIEPIGDAWLQFCSRYYMFALVFVIIQFRILLFYSSHPGLHPRSLDKNQNMKRETKNITTVYTKSLRVSITQSPRSYFFFKKKEKRFSIFILNI